LFWFGCGAGNRESAHCSVPGTWAAPPKAHRGPSNPWHLPLLNTLLPVDLGATNGDLGRTTASWKNNRQGIVKIRLLVILTVACWGANLHLAQAFEYSHARSRSAGKLFYAGTFFMARPAFPALPRAGRTILPDASASPRAYLIFGRPPFTPENRFSASSSPLWYWHLVRQAVGVLWWCFLFHLDYV